MKLTRVMSGVSIATTLCFSSTVAFAASTETGFDFATPKHMAKQPVFTANGMVTATSPLATYVGTKVLEDGGNAFDAAVAVALMLNAVDPSMCGPGGAAFFVLYDAKKKEVVTLDAGTQTPYEATIDKFKTDGKEDRQLMLEGVTSMAIPGAIAGYFAVLDKYGTKSFAELSAPAIHYLENGYPLSQATHTWLTKAFPEVPMLFPNLARVYAPDGTWPDIGVLMKNPDLARTYKVLAKEGVKGFYTGPIAQEMVDYVRENGGFWTMKDLADYKVRWTKPLKTTYKGYDIYGAPPPASSMTWMQMLRLSEQFDLKALGYNTPEYLHLITEIERLAHADSYQFGGDPEFDDTPAQETLSDNYIKAQVKRIDLRKAAPGKVVPGNPREWSKHTGITPDAKPIQVAAQTTQQTRINTMYTGNTTHVNVIDKDGNAVSFTHTLGTFFGGHDILGKTGVVGNNGINWGDLEVSHWTGQPSNIGLKPGKRNRWTLCPGMFLKDGKPVLLIGGSGADTTQPAVFQSTLNMLEWSMNPQAAISAPRSVYGDMRHYTGGTRLSIDPEIRDANDVAAKLKAMGHDVVGADEVYRPVPGYALSIMVHPLTRVKVGGAETRIDGHVNGY